MDLLNNTSFSAKLFQAGLEDDQMAACAIVRVVYEVEHGQLRISEQQDWPVSFEDRETIYGTMVSDLVYRKGGVDLLVFGEAKSKVPVEKMDISLTVNENILAKLTVFGDRYWEKTSFGIRPGSPSPFTEMPVRLEHAFGGKAMWDGLEIPYPQNPVGKGYCLDEESALGNPLPNIEDPTNLIFNWSDHVIPVGFGSCPLNQRPMHDNLVIGDNGKITSVLPGFFNAAFPPLVAPEILPGDRISVTGMSLPPQFTFQIPAVDFEVELTLGEKQAIRPMKIDQVGIIPGESKAFITYRFPFRYEIRPREIRTCSILDNKIIIS